MSLRLNLGNLSNSFSSQALRAGGVYLSGALYAAAFYLILDSALWSRHKNPSDLHIGFVDWIPLLLGSLGMAVINLVEKTRLNSGVTFSSEYSGSENWQAKVVLFMGFAFLSGGLAGSVVILVLRYLLHHHSTPVLNMGISNVLSSVSVMASCASLWIAQNLQDDYSYSLQL